MVHEHFLRQSEKSLEEFQPSCGQDECSGGNYDHPHPTESWKNPSL